MLKSSQKPLEYGTVRTVYFKRVQFMQLLKPFTVNTVRWSPNQMSESDLTSSPNHFTFDLWSSLHSEANCAFSQDRIIIPSSIGRLYRYTVGIHRTVRDVQLFPVK